MTLNCVLFTGKLSPEGYGRLGKLYAHRVAYEGKYGIIPAGHHLHHKCEVRACINPDHLEPITPREHLLQHDSACMTNGKKTHCPHDHEYTPENTYRDKVNGRKCRACHRIKEKKRRLCLAL